jgi:hypothetical protein
MCAKSQVSMATGYTLDGPMGLAQRSAPYSTRRWILAHRAALCLISHIQGSGPNVILGLHSTVGGRHVATPRLDGHARTRTTMVSLNACGVASDRPSTRRSESDETRGTLIMLAGLWAALRDLVSVRCFRARHAIRLAAHMWPWLGRFHLQRVPYAALQNRVAPWRVCGDTRRDRQGDRRQ